MVSSTSDGIEIFSIMQRPVEIFTCTELSPRYTMAYTMGNM